MKFLKERAGIIVRELDRLATIQSIRIENWKVKKGCFIDLGEVDSSDVKWEDFHSSSDRWYGPDKHYWFRAEFTVPKELDQKPLWLRIRTQLEDWDDGRNPQFLVFLNGQITQGLDINHREIYLTDCAKAGDRYQIDMQAYTGTLHREFTLLADAEEIHPEIRGLSYDLLIPIEAMNRMPENDKIRLDMETVVNDTINLIDLRKPYSHEFFTSITAAREYIKKALYEDMAGYEDVIATCIGHTHIDVAWLWTVDQVRQKVCRSFATVLKFMKEYPNYKFMSSQPQLYKFVKERHPEEYEEIKQRIKEGRWEPEGGMWVEADCNLTSGESLVRQFLFGKRFFKEEFGVDNRILWLPDVFGYSAALPQICKKSGIDFFMTTKLSWNQFNKIPYDTFVWEGIDGSSVLTHMITTVGIGQNISNFFTTYNGMLHPDAIMGGWERYQNKDINNDILISYGFGDGGGGPTRTMLETSMRMEKGLKGVPKVRQELPRKYFEELEARVKDNRRLPRWVGELYFEYHRGTLTSMGRNKRSNRKSEYMMMELEFLAVLAMKYGRQYPVDELNQMWELILRNQFHDILPGSSIHEVYETTKIEYENIKEQAEANIKACLNSFILNDEGVTVINTLGFERDDIVNLGSISAEALTDGIEIYPVQCTEKGNIAYVRGIPSKGYKVLMSCEGDAISPFIIHDNKIETPYYVTEFSKDGLIISLYDKENERYVIKEGRAGNELRIYEDKPMSFSNWDIDIYYQEKSWPVNDTLRMEWTERGPIRACLTIEKMCMDTTIKQNIYFYADERRIDFENTVDWKFSEHLMKVHFPVDVHTDEATFDIQFGNIKRKIHQNTSWDVARFEACGHKWVDLSEGGYGVSLMNDCKYGHSIGQGELTLTLIKSGTEPNATTDQEVHYFTYSLYPHGGTWKEGATVENSFKLNVPLKAVQGIAEKPYYSFAGVDRRNVILETIKVAEDGDGIILRLYEVENTRCKVKVTLADEIARVVETNLMEEAEKEQKVSLTQDGFTFEIKPYEIKTFRVYCK